MLQLRPAQIQAMTFCLNPDFEDVAVSRLRELFPELEEYHDLDLRLHVRLAAKKGAAYGIEDSENLLMLAAFMVLYGGEFEVDFPQTQAILEAPERTANQRIDMLFKFAEHFEMLLRGETPINV